MALSYEPDGDRFLGERLVVQHWAFMRALKEGVESGLTVDAAVEWLVDEELWSTEIPGVDERITVEDTEAAVAEAVRLIRATR
jgi:hypothetical protein